MKVELHHFPDDLQKIVKENQYEVHTTYINFKGPATQKLIGEIFTYYREQQDYTNETDKFHAIYTADNSLYLVHEVPEDYPSISTYHQLNPEAALSTIFQAATELIEHFDIEPDSFGLAHFIEGKLSTYIQGEN